MSDYSGKPYLIRGTGGAVRVTVPATPFQVQANAGTSIPCAGCFVSPASGNTGLIRMNIAAAASTILGIELSDADTGNGPMWVPIDDVAKLYFVGDTENDVVDILYMKG